MHLKPATINSLATILGPRLALAGGRLLHQSSAYNQYCLLYSSNSSRQKRHQWGQQIRQANTSSSFFAPPTLTSNQRATSQAPRGNLSVFEDSDHLPSLPVPELHRTLEMLKETISPIAMNSSEFVQTLQLIDEFAKSAGPKLDLLLRSKANQTKNWMTHDWWTKQIYLKSRQPLVINSNPGMSYPIFPFEVNNQRSLVNVTAQLISGIIDFKLSLIHGYNPEASNSADEVRLDPNLCYNQYQNIFGSTRIPSEQIDIQRVKQLTSNLENVPFTLVVSFKGNFFEIQLNNVEDEKDRTDKLAGILDKIIATFNHTKKSSPIVDELSTSHNQTAAGYSRGHNNSQDSIGAGVLTTARRDDWAQAYKLLDGDSMKSIQEAQFVVCLDTIPAHEHGYPDSLLHHPADSEQHMAALGRQILHGDLANVGNRWFDKSFQLIVVTDENAERLLGAGINYEHSFGEGTLVTKIIEYSYDKTVQKHRDSSNSDNFFARQEIASSEPATFRQLPMFDASNSAAISKFVEKAKQDFASQVDQFDMSYLRYKNYGRNSIKSWHFSPDSWFQVALQLAYYNVHKRLGSCYESASTRRFAYGRTETIRSLTKEVAQFCYDPRFETMQPAIQSHKTYALAAGNGNAIDRTLMGYRMAFNELRANEWAWGYQSKQDIALDQVFSEEELSTIGTFFNNELINRSFKFSLSTSQVPSTHSNICMSYGPLLADGYGCCYNITGQQIAASITANSSNQSFSCEVDMLHESLERSLDTMRDIVEDNRS